MSVSAPASEMAMPIPCGFVTASRNRMKLATTMSTGTLDCSIDDVERRRRLRRQIESGVEGGDPERRQHEHDAPAGEHRLGIPADVRPCERRMTMQPTSSARRRARWAGSPRRRCAPRWHCRPRTAGQQHEKPRLVGQARAASLRSRDCLEIADQLDILGAGTAGKRDRGASCGPASLRHHIGLPPDFHPAFNALIRTGNIGHSCQARPAHARSSPTKNQGFAALGPSSPRPVPDGMQHRRERRMAGSVRDLFSTIESFMTDKTARARRTTDASDGYTAADIEVLEGLEPVRRRPGMYIGGTDEKAMHHLFAEVIDNSMDEAVAGHATWIEVEFDKEGFLSVTDNGRGMPVDPHPKFKNKSALEVIMCTLHSGGKFDGKAYNTSGGLHGVGVSVVNALSDVCEVEVARGQQLYRMDFSRGEPTDQAAEARPGHEPARHQGALQAGREDFRQGRAFKPARLFKMARSKAYLFGGVEIRWTCDASLITDDTPTSATFRFPGGLADYLTSEIAGRTHGDQGSVRRPHQGRERPRLGRMGRRLDRRRRRLPALLLQHHPDARRRHARDRPAHGAVEGPARLRRADQQPPRRADHRRRRDGHVGGHAVGVHPRAGIPGPDQGPPRHAGSGAHRREHRARRLRPLARRQPACRRRSCSNGRSTRPRSA